MTASSNCAMPIWRDGRTVEDRKDVSLAGCPRASPFSIPPSDSSLPSRYFSSSSSSVSRNVFHQFLAHLVGGALQIRRESPLSANLPAVAFVEISLHRQQIDDAFEIRLPRRWAVADRLLWLPSFRAAASIRSSTLACSWSILVDEQEPAHPVLIGSAPTSARTSTRRPDGWIEHKHRAAEGAHAVDRVGQETPRNPAYRSR